MIDNNRREVFLADWITGALPDDTLKRLVSREDYDLFILLRKSLSGMQSPIPDFELSYQQIQDKITRRRLYNSIYFSVSKRPNRKS